MTMPLALQGTIPACILAFDEEQLVMLNRLRVPIVRPPLPTLDEPERHALRQSLVAAGLLDVPVGAAGATSD